MKPGQGPHAPVSRPPGSQMSISGRMVPKIALGSPLHSKERTSPLGGSALGPAGLCHRAVCLPACPQPRSMWSGLSLCLSEQPPQSRPAPTVPGRTPTATGPQLSGGVLAFNLTTPPPHAGTHRRNALATPLPEARKLQSPLSPPDYRAASHLLSSLHMVVHICHRCSLNASHPLRPPHFHKSVLCIHISTPSLKIRTSVPFVWDFCGG